MAKDTRSNRKAAQEALNDKIHDKLKDRSPLLKKDNITLQELTDIYLKYQENTVTKSTWQRNTFAVHTILRLLGSDTIAEDLTAGYVKDRFSSDTSTPGTINERYTRFKAIIRWAYENDYLSDIRYIDKIKPLKDDAKIKKLREKYLESDELSKLLDNMKVQDWKNLTEFLALSGLRCGEALALTNPDIDFKSKLIHVTKTYDVVNCIVTDPKTPESIRDIYMRITKKQKEKDIEAVKYAQLL